MRYEGDSSQTLAVGLMVNLPQCKVETSEVETAMKWPPLLQTSMRFLGALALRQRSLYYEIPSLSLFFFSPLCHAI